MRGNFAALDGAGPVTRVRSARAAHSIQVGFLPLAHGPIVDVIRWI